MTVLRPYRPRQSVQRAVLYMLIAAITLPGLSACGKYLSGYPISQVTWARYAGHFAFMILVFAPRNGLGILRSARPGLQLARSGLHCASSALFFAGIAALSLSTATAIFFSGPILVTALAPFLLKERLGPGKVAAAGVGFAGTLVVIRPGWTVEYLAVSLVIASAVASALFQILSRKLADHDRPLTSNTYMVLIGFLLTSLTLPFAWRTPETTGDLLVFVVMGLVGGLGHYFLASAFELAPAAVVAPLNYAQLIGAIILGYLFFGEVADMWTWIGSAVIALGGALVFFQKAPVPGRVS